MACKTSPHVSVTATFYIHHQDDCGSVTLSQRVSCVDITEELLSLPVEQIRQMAQNLPAVLNALQSFSLERAQYEAMTHYSIALDDPSSVLRLFDLPVSDHAGLGRLLELDENKLTEVREEYGFTPRVFEVHVAQVRRCVRTVKVTATNQYEAGHRAMRLVEQDSDAFEYQEQEFFVDEVTSAQDQARLSEQLEMAKLENL
ncbi:hypothetical protein [Neopusillimonas maritima]|uniref:hypothetical protein n=1 Tax=Neopusillimonas maritima TaxID=2026239 RepID=UPI0011C44293|nr:hypothetical protein [Neopusillimonas maritima]